MYSYDRTFSVSKTASDLQVHDVEFASGQEPDDAIETGEGFATLVRVEFTVSGRALAKLLGKQERVLEKALQTLKPPQFLFLASDNQEVLRGVTPAVKRMVQRYVVSKGGEASRMAVSFAEESDLPFRAKADIRNKSILFEMEFEVEGG